MQRDQAEGGGGPDRRRASWRDGRVRDPYEKRGGGGANAFPEIEAAVDVPLPNQQNAFSTPPTSGRTSSIFKSVAWAVTPFSYFTSKVAGLAGSTPAEAGSVAPEENAAEHDGDAGLDGGAVPAGSQISTRAIVLDEEDNGLHQEVSCANGIARTSVDGRPREREIPVSQPVPLFNRSSPTDPFQNVFRNANPSTVQLLLPETPVARRPEDGPPMAASSGFNFPPAPPMASPAAFRPHLVSDSPYENLKTLLTNSPLSTPASPWGRARPGNVGTRTEAPAASPTPGLNGTGPLVPASPIWSASASRMRPLPPGRSRFATSRHGGLGVSAPGLQRNGAHRASTGGLSRTPLHAQALGGRGNGMTAEPTVSGAGSQNLEETAPLAPSWTPMRTYSSLQPKTHLSGLKRPRQDDSPGEERGLDTIERRIRQRGDVAVGSAERRVWHAGSTPFVKGFWPGQGPGRAPSGPEAADRRGSGQEVDAMTGTARRIISLLDSLDASKGTLALPAPTEPAPLLPPPSASNLGSFLSAPPAPVRELGWGHAASAGTSEAVPALPFGSNLGSLPTTPGFAGTSGSTAVPSFGAPKLLSLTEVSGAAMASSPPKALSMPPPILPATSPATTRIPGILPLTPLPFTTPTAPSAIVPPASRPSSIGKPPSHFSFRAATSVTAIKDELLQQGSPASGASAEPAKPAPFGTLVPFGAQPWALSPSFTGADVPNPFAPPSAPPPSPSVSTAGLFGRAGSPTKAPAGGPNFSYSAARPSSSGLGMPVAPAFAKTSAASTDVAAKPAVSAAFEFKPPFGAASSSGVLAGPLGSGPLGKERGPGLPGPRESKEANQVVEKVAAAIPLPDSGSEDEDGSQEEGSEGGEASLSDGVGLHENGDEGISTPGQESSKPSGLLDFLANATGAQGIGAPGGNGFPPFAPASNSLFKFGGSKPSVAASEAKVPAKSEPPLKAAEEQAPSSAPVVSGWGDAFLKNNKANEEKMAAALKEEVDKANGVVSTPAAANGPTPTFVFGAVPVATSAATANGINGINAPAQPVPIAGSAKREGSGGLNDSMMSISPPKGGLVSSFGGTTGGLGTQPQPQVPKLTTTGFTLPTNGSQDAGGAPQAPPSTGFGAPPTFTFGAGTTASTFTFGAKQEGGATPPVSSGPTFAELVKNNTPSQAPQGAPLANAPGGAPSSITTGATGFTSIPNPFGGDPSRAPSSGFGAPPSAFGAPSSNGAGFAFGQSGMGGPAPFGSTPGSFGGPSAVAPPLTISSSFGGTPVVPPPLTVQHPPAFGAAAPSAGGFGTGTSGAAAPTFAATAPSGGGFGVGAAPSSGLGGTATPSGGFGMGAPAIGGFGAGQSIAGGAAPSFGVAPGGGFGGGAAPAFGSGPAPAFGSTAPGPFGASHTAPAFSGQNTYGAPGAPTPGGFVFGAGAGPAAGGGMTMGTTGDANANRVAIRKKKFGKR